MIATLHRLSAPYAILEDQHATGVEREFVRIVSGSGRIDRCSAVAGPNTVPPHLPTGFKAQGDACDYLVRWNRATGFAFEPLATRYRNGDGFATELGNERFRFFKNQAADCGDAGFDLKGPDWEMDGDIASGCAHNFRFWSSGWARTITSWRPKADPSKTLNPVHVWVSPAPEYKERQVIRLDRLILRGPGIAIQVETKPGAIPPLILVGSYEFAGVTEILRVIGPAPEIDWGPQGAPSL